MLVQYSEVAEILKPGRVVFRYSALLVGTDFLGPLPWLRSGEQHFVANRNFFKEIPKVCALARVTARKVVMEVCVVGVVKSEIVVSLISDDSARFALRLFQFNYRMVGTTSSYTYSSHHKTNRQVTKYGRELVAML